ncbi:hypothetical protein TWF730_002883 [Orbilia blumenaviensis]|uniref:Uncharacterized protein n=1 Tax=Orbilia blumenaviensis TaxID=1796055 RepID=A0AAV9UAX4_9PEZI
MPVGSMVPFAKIDVSSLSLHTMQILLFGLLSLSTTHAYYIGEVYTGQAPEAFQRGWMPDWRGTSYVNRCIPTKRNIGGSTEHLQGLGIINGAAPPGGVPVNSRYGPAMSGHNIAALMLYKSNDCEITGTNQFIILKFKQIVPNREGGLPAYRGVSNTDLNLLNGVNLNEYQSFQEIDDTSRDWVWVIGSEVPDSEGEVVVWEENSDGTYSVARRLTIRVPGQKTVAVLAQSLENNQAEPAISNLRVALQSIAEIRYVRPRNERAGLVNQAPRSGPQEGNIVRIPWGALGINNPVNPASQDTSANTAGQQETRGGGGNVQMVPTMPGRTLNFSYKPRPGVDQNPMSSIPGPNDEKSPGPMSGNSIRGQNESGLPSTGVGSGRTQVGNTLIAQNPRQQQRPERGQGQGFDLRAGADEIIPELTNQGNMLQGQGGGPSQQQYSQQRPNQSALIPQRLEQQPGPGLSQVRPVQPEPGTRLQQTGDRPVIQQPFYEMMQPIMYNRGNLKGQPINQQVMPPQGSGRILTQGSGRPLPLGEGRILPADPQNSRSQGTQNGPPPNWLQQNLQNALSRSSQSRPSQEPQSLQNILSQNPQNMISRTSQNPISQGSRSDVPGPGTRQNLVPLVEQGVMRDSAPSQIILPPTLQNMFPAARSGQDDIPALLGTIPGTASNTGRSVSEMIPELAHTNQNLAPQNVGGIDLTVSQNVGSQNQPQPGPGPFAQNENLEAPELPATGDRPLDTQVNNQIPNINNDPNPNDFGFNSFIIPDQAPQGTFNQLYGNLPELAGNNQIPSRRILTEGRLMPPTSPTLFDETDTNPAYATDEHAQLNRLDRAFGRRAQLNVPFPSTNLGQPYVPWVPPRRGDDKYKVKLQPGGPLHPNPYEGGISEGVEEEGVHFPTLFDRLDPMRRNGVMELEPEWAERQEREEELPPVGEFPNSRVRPQELYDAWRRYGTPILGNLRSFPTTWADPAWALIDQTYNELYRDIQTNWFDFYQERIDAQVPAYLEVQGRVQKAYTAVELQRSKAAKGLETAKSKAQVNGLSLSRQLELAREITELTKLLQSLDDSLGTLRYKWARNKYTLERWKRVYDRQLADLSIRFDVWLYLSAENVARNIDRLAQIERDPEFGTFGGEPPLE